MSATARADAASRYGQLPLAFEPNLGQTDSAIKFVARGDGYALFLGPREAMLGLRGPLSSKQSREENRSTGSHSAGLLRMQLAGASADPKLVALDELPGKTNYLIGKNPANWHSNIPNYRKVLESGVYRGVDLVYYGSQRQLEYDFIVAPEADPRVIRLAIEDAGELHVDSQGDLVFAVPGGEVRFKKPLSYQETKGGKLSSRVIMSWRILAR
jgi:hypothetical protein